MITLTSLILELGAKDVSDEYYYHVTLAPYIPLIKARGLTPNKKATVSNYRDYSRGKLFFCDVGTVEWWINKIGEHAFHQFDDEKFHNVAVFRVLKSKIQNTEGDMIGSYDSGGKTYYIKHSVPPQDVEFVKFVAEPY